MSYQLELTLMPAPEVLERVLRVTRHRGFTITDMQLSTQQNKQLHLYLTVTSTNEITLLSKQLDKLIDVVSCVILEN